MTDGLRSGYVHAEDGYAVIRITLEDVHSLRVALHRCPCKAAKSNSTADIRDRLERALGTLAAAPRAVSNE